MSDDELMGRNEFARHMQVAPNAVLKAVRDGRISRAVVYGTGGKIKGIRWRQAEALWSSNTDPAQALKSRKHPGPALSEPREQLAQVQTSARPPSPPTSAETPRPVWLQRRLSELLAQAAGASMIAWAGQIVARLGLGAEDALEIAQDGLFVLNVAGVEILGIDPDIAQVKLPREFSLAQAERNRALERVREVAEELSVAGALPQ